MKLEQAALTVLAGQNQPAMEEASKFMNHAAKQLASIMPLYTLLKHQNPGVGPSLAFFPVFFARFVAHDQQVRQLGAILLRKAIGRHWSKMPGKAQEEFKQSLLQLVAQEANRDVRNGLCELVASVAKFSAQWPNLFQFIVQISGAPEPALRETAFRILQAMTETVGKMLKNNFANIQPLLRKGLADGDNAVRVRALRAINGLVTHLESEKDVNLLRPLIEPAVKVVGYCVENNLVADTIDSLDLFNDLLQQSELERALDGYLQPLLQFMVGIVRSPKVDIHARDTALSFVQNLAAGRTKQFLQNKWLQPILDMMIPMMSEPLADDDDPDELSSQRLALSCLDILCSAIPEKYIGVPVLGLAAQLHKSANWLERKGCLEVLTVASRGCFIFMRDHVGDYLPALIASFSDPHIEVRMSAGVALATFCEYLQEPVIKRHEQLVPLLAQAMRDQEAVAMRALYALQFFSEELGAAFAPYADTFMTVLLQFAANGSPKTKDVAIGAVGSIAVALGPLFVKYLGPVVAMLKTFMNVRVEELLEVRGRACEVAGCVANAVTRQVIGDPTLQEFSRLAFDGLSIVSDQHQFALRTAIYGYFTNLASVLGADFMPLLQQLYPYIMATITSDEGVVGETAGNSNGLESLVEAGDDGEEGGEEGFTEGDKVNFSFRIPFVEEKKVAVMLVGSLGLALGKSMAGVVEQFMPELLELCDYMHADIRQQAVKALPAMVHIVNDTWPSPAGKWERGKFSNERPLNKNVLLILKPVIDVILAMIREDRDGEAVTCAVEALPKIFEELGPVSMEGQIKEILSAILMIFDKQTFFQTLREKFDEDERDLELFNATVDCVVDMLRCAGPTQFGCEIFKLVYPKMVVMFKDQPEAYRALAMGALAEYAVHIEHMIQPVAAEMLKMALVGVTSDDVVTRRNALYCMGSTVQFGGPSVVAAIPTVLQRIQTFLKSDDPAGVDNAVGALCRIILTGNDQLPIAEILPAIFAHLPLKIDVEPYGPIFHALVKLIRSPAANLMLPHLPAALKTAFHALLNDAQKLDHRSRPGIEVFVRFIGMGEQKGVLQQVVQSLPPYQQQQLKEKYKM